MSPRFSSASRAALARAKQLASREKNQIVGSAHLLLALLEAPHQNDEESEDRVSALLLLSGVSRAETQIYAQSALAADEGDARSQDRYSLALERVLSLARTHTYAEIIEPEHLLVALSRPQNGPHVGAVMRPLGLKSAQLDKLLRQIEREQAHRSRPLRMLDKRAKAALEAAHQTMRAHYCGRVSTLHLLIGLLETRSPIRVFLEKQGVNLADLRDVAAKAQGNDGAIGGPQVQLAPVAKRAIERAKKLALSNRGQRIAPEHLWLALLPRRASWREKARWGGALNDPLDEVWRRFESAPLQSALRSYLAATAPARTSPPIAPHKVSNLHFDWQWVAAGLAWSAWFFAGLTSGFVMFLVALGVGMLLAIAGAVSRFRPLRDSASSWLCGVMAGLFLALIISAKLR